MQIGAVRVETRTFSVIDRFELVVRPKVNPELSDFCQAFTCISQARLDAEGIPFAAALGRFEAFLDGVPVLVCNADADVYRENVEINDLPNSIPEYLRTRGRLEAIRNEFNALPLPAWARWQRAIRRAGSRPSLRTGRTTGKPRKRCTWLMGPRRSEA
ncbi:exonuclease domain-containing protein [Allgaiera indica]|uniref:exonuclease domain-containing protein n=1 Tax=Allgaiera indica TaxID=765699 RepID=UPI00244F0208|nr:exonuclease domain-containing protein [Allgaiera indica]